MAQRDGPPDDEPDPIPASDVDRTLADLDESLSDDDSQNDSDQSLSGGDQTLSDSDQTRSDSDQTLSERDQQASDDDQAASDLDFDHGGDAATHARSTAARVETTRERGEVTDDRDRTADERDRAARERDAIAAQRDRDAAIADQRGLELDGSDGVDSPSNLDMLRIQELRAQDVKRRRRAALDRERAARDRERAARDRREAARDREQARRDRERAGIDELTGARRRGVGLDELQREIERARRTEQDLVAVYLDVDGLKQVNDTHGHGAGDQLLRDVVTALRHQMRSYDLLVRLGGDEFLCALPGVTVDEARERLDALAEELRRGPNPASVSVGLAMLRDGDGPQELIDRADRELLAARGR